MLRVRTKKGGQEMAVDPSKLKRLGRRGLGAPPTDGSPGMEESATDATPPGPGTQPAVVYSRPEQHEGTRALADEQKIPVPPIAATLQDQEPSPAPSNLAGLDLGAAGQPEFKPQVAAPAPGRVPTAASSDGAATAAPLRRRVPPRQEEPRIPFTTRIAVSTKERLEDACYHLRTKHQAFIDEAIQIHLRKHGF
jgi:hypothetical protein